MKRNETASKSMASALIMKAIGVAIAVVLSGCAVTGSSSSDELTADMPFNDFHYGP